MMEGVGTYERRHDKDIIDFDPLRISSLAMRSHAKDDTGQDGKEKANGRAGCGVVSHRASIRTRTKIRAATWNVSTTQGPLREEKIKYCLDRRTKRRVWSAVMVESQTLPLTQSGNRRLNAARGHPTTNHKPLASSELARVVHPRWPQKRGQSTSTTAMEL